MKIEKFVRFVLTLVATFFAFANTGCAGGWPKPSANAAKWNRPGETMAIGATELPDRPFRNSSYYYRSATGDREVSRSQGSDVSAFRTYDCCGQPQTVVQMNSYKWSSETRITPPPRQFIQNPVVDAPSGARAGTIYFPGNR